MIHQMQDLSFLENRLLVCLFILKFFLYSYVLTALWLHMLEQIFYLLTCEMLELSIPKLFHSVVTDCIIYSHFEMLNVKTFESSSSI